MLLTCHLNLPKPFRNGRKSVRTMTVLHANLFISQKNRNGFSERDLMSALAQLFPSEGTLGHTSCRISAREVAAMKCFVWVERSGVLTQMPSSPLAKSWIAGRQVKQGSRGSLFGVSFGMGGRVSGTESSHSDANSFACIAVWEGRQKTRLMNCRTTSPSLSNGLKSGSGICKMQCNANGLTR